MNKQLFVKQYGHQSIPGVKILSREQDKIAAGEFQEVMVVIEAHHCIPLHTHSCDASMVILEGDAIVLSDDVRWNNKYVAKDDLVFFEKNIAHGFKALANGMTFLSRNAGIVDADSNKWDIHFSSSH